MNERISVIVPVYNVAHRLDKCIQSIVNQTYPHLEIILVDDGSRDNSGEICDQWKEKDDRIVVIHKPNGGMSSARNAGLDIANGEWIAFVDSDDYIERDMYECLLSEGKTLAADIVIGGLCVEVDGRVIDAYKTPFTFQKEYTSHEWMKHFFLNDRTCGMTTVVWNKLYRKSVWNGVRFKLGYIHEDDEIVAHIYTKDYRIAVIDRPFYHYVKNNNSICNSPYSEKKWISVMNIFFSRIEAFRDWDDSLAAQAARLFCNLYIEHFYKAQKAGIAIRQESKQMYVKAVKYYRQAYGIDKTYIRFLIFKGSPLLYGKLTGNSL